MRPFWGRMPRFAETPIRTDTIRDEMDTACHRRHTLGELSMAHTSNSSGIPLVILGSGYTGRWVYRLRRESCRSVFVTSRDPDSHLAYAEADERRHFDLRQPDTWRSIPPAADLLWCFPAEPLDLVTAFARHAALHNRRIVVLGSTSAYDTDPRQDAPPPWIDESAPLDRTKPRVQGEEFLQSACNATVLRVAGIYGPGRNPLDWIRDGRVGTARKYVNLIHVEDLAAICLFMVERGKAGEVYNVSDGTPRTWESICRVAQARWDIVPTGPAHRTDTGKRLATAKLQAQLGGTLRHPDLFMALQELEGGPGTDEDPARRGRGL